MKSFSHSVIQSFSHPMKNVLPIIWTEFSCGNKCKRTFTIMTSSMTTEKTYASIVMENVVYWRWLGETDAIEAVDPNGGPFLSKGYRIGESNWIIDKILSVEQQGKSEDFDHTLIILVEVISIIH